MQKSNALNVINLAWQKYYSTLVKRGGVLYSEVRFIRNNI
jgi:hypothetical protein